MRLKAHDPRSKHIKPAEMNYNPGTGEVAGTEAQVMPATVLSHCRGIVTH